MGMLVASPSIKVLRASTEDWSTIIAVPVICPATSKYLWYTSITSLSEYIPFLFIFITDSLSSFNPSL